MEGLEEINYTIVEPENTYWSDTYSPGQTKLQLEIGQEVNPEKVKDDRTLYEAGTHFIRTRSKNVVLKITAYNLPPDNDSSSGVMIGQIRNQKAWAVSSNAVKEGYIYWFSDSNYGKIKRVFTGGFEIEMVGMPVSLSYEAYNTSL